MVSNVGVLGIQGAISEHVDAMSRVLKEEDVKGTVFVVKHRKQIDNIDGLIIPGGESTTISQILCKSGIYDEILKRVERNDLPIMGTCAGCVMLAKEIIDHATEIEPLRLMNMQIKRNAFGRQRHSFEQKIDINGFTQPYNAVFIRAPLITKVWGKCKILAKIDKKIVMARQDNLLASSFHPELTDDLRIHEYFLEMCLGFHNCQ